MKLADRLIFGIFFIFLLAFAILAQVPNQNAHAGWEPFALASPTPTPSMTPPRIPPAYSPPTIPGDYNRDCYVDRRDYRVWWEQQGLRVVPYAGADGNGNGRVDAADYTIWKDHENSSQPNCHAVPAPTPTAAAGAEPKNFIKPSHGDIYTLTLNLAGPTHVRADVYTVRGEKVKNLLDADLPAGSHNVAWNGQNEKGDIVASDMYIILIYENDRLSQKKKVIIQR